VLYLLPFPAVLALLIPSPSSTEVLEEERRTLLQLWNASSQHFIRRKACPPPVPPLFLSSPITFSPKVDLNLHGSEFLLRLALLFPSLQVPLHIFLLLNNFLFPSTFWFLHRFILSDCPLKNRATVVPFLSFFFSIFLNFRFYSFLYKLSSILSFTSCIHSRSKFARPSKRCSLYCLD